MTEEGKTKLEVASIFLGTILVPSLVYFLAAGFPPETRIAAAGGLLAVYGTMLIAWPIWRVGGPYAWIANEAVREALALPLDERPPSRRYRPSDRFYSMLYGPMLVGVGTGLNGISGFFAGT